MYIAFLSIDPTNVRTAPLTDTSLKWLFKLVLNRFYIALLNKVTDLAFYLLKKDKVKFLFVA